MHLHCVYTCVYIQHSNSNSSPLTANNHIANDRPGLVPWNLYTTEPQLTCRHLPFKQQQQQHLLTMALQRSKYIHPTDVLLILHWTK